jgi:hypothetical protein
MGGQACILYGAAEFSRDIDVAILASDENLQRLRGALADLRAEALFVSKRLCVRRKMPSARGIAPIGNRFEPNFWIGGGAE